jgi:hypothetical protein
MSYATSILSYGAIGLGFLLAWLAYRLLQKEQAVATPRQSILRSVYVFECFAVVLVIIGAILEYTNNEAKAGASATSTENTSLRAELKATKDKFEVADKRAQAGDQCEAKFKQYAAIATNQNKAINDAASTIQKILKDLAAQNALAVADSCPGGAHGVPSNHAGEITALNTQISADVATVKGTLGSVAEFKAPQ